MNLLTAAGGEIFVTDCKFMHFFIRKKENMTSIIPVQIKYVSYKLTHFSQGTSSVGQFL